MDKFHGAASSTQQNDIAGFILDKDQSKADVDVKLILSRLMYSRVGRPLNLLHTQFILPS